MSKEAEYRRNGLEGDELISPSNSLFSHFPSTDTLFGGVSKTSEAWNKFQASLIFVRTCRRPRSGSVAIYIR